MCVLDADKYQLFLIRHKHLNIYMKCLPVYCMVDYSKKYFTSWLENSVALYLYLFFDQHINTSKIDSKLKYLRFLTSA